MLKLIRTADGYTTKDGRFVIEKTQGRAYTRGPFKNFWSVTDTKTGKGHRHLPLLNDARAFILATLSKGIS